MSVLAKCLQKQYTRMPHEIETLAKMVSAIVEGATACCSCMTQGRLFRYLFAPTDDKENLQGIESILAKVQGQLTLIIGMDAQERATDMQQQIPRRRPLSKYKAPHAVGIEDRVNRVIELLDLGAKQQRRAVMLYGFGGVGKTSLADCVMSQLDFGGLKHSRIQLADNQSDMKSYREELYADLKKERLHFKDCGEGQQKLQEVLIKESTFTFIDNALRKEQINDLSPPDLFLPAECRMMLTSWDKHVSSELQIGGIRCVEYPVEELPPDAAKRFFREIGNRCEQTNSEVEAKSMSLEKMDTVAEQCHGVPLLLRVSALYLARHGTEPRVYTGGLAAVREGDFSYTDKGLGDKLLSVYHQLRQDKQDAFVDACTYCHALGRDTREIKGIWLIESEDVLSIESQYISAVSGSLRVLAVGSGIRFTGECRISLPKLRFLCIQYPAEGLPIFERMGTLQYTCLIDNGENLLFAVGEY